MTTERIEIVVSSKGTVTVKKEIEDIGKSAKKAGGELDLLKGVLAGFLSVRTFQAFADITSTFTDYQARLAMVADTTLSAEDAMERLFDVANRTYSSFDNTAEIFLRNQLALEGLGMSANEVLDYTEALNNALVISGAKAQQAESTINALSNSMMLGALRGQNLQTVLAQGGEVVRLLAKELGVTSDKLLGLGAQGKITAEVIRNALIGNFDMLRQKADEMPATINDAFLRIGENFKRLIFQTDQLYGASTILASGLVWVADNLELVLMATTPLIAALGVLAVQVIGTTVIQAFLSMQLAIVNVITVLRSLFLLIMANPLTAVAVAIAAVLVYMVDWQVAIQRLIELWGSLVETIGTALDALGWSTGMAEKGLQIRINAEEASRQMYESLSWGGAEINEGIEAGSRTGAALLKDGVVAGAQQGAAAIRAAGASAAGAVANAARGAGQSAGQAVAEGGKSAGQTIKKDISDGSKQAGVEVMRGTAEGGNQAAGAIKDAMDQGGKSAGSSVGNAIEVAGVKFAQNVFNAFREAIDVLISAQIQLLNEQANLFRAQADAISRGKSSGSDYGGGSSKGGGSGGGGSRSRTTRGGTIIDWAGIFRGERSIHEYSTNPDVRNKAIDERIARDDERAKPAVTINNYVDPQSQLDVLDTQAGHDKVMNIIQYNLDDLRAKMGAV